MPQPQKGPRELLGTRVSPALAGTVRAAAAEAGLSVSDYLGNLLAVQHGHKPMALPVASGQMKLTA